MSTISCGSPVLLGELDALAHVRGDDERREGRRRVVVRVLAAGLVLDEEARAQDLADVVVVGARRVRAAGSRRCSAAAVSARLPVMTEWLYVPGASIMSRLSSGWPGLASSSKRTSVVTPKTSSKNGSRPSMRMTVSAPPTRPSPPATDAGAACRLDERRTERRRARDRDHEPARRDEPGALADDAHRGHARSACEERADDVRAVEDAEQHAHADADDRNEDADARVEQQRREDGRKRERENVRRDAGQQHLGDPRPVHDAENEHRQNRQVTQARPHVVLVAVADRVRPHTRASSRARCPRTRSSRGS